jgi:signal transduction histidine kinase
MKKFWKPFAELGTAFKNSFSIDIFTAARFKIAFLYLIMGLVILSVAGYVVYAHILDIVQQVIQIIQQLLAQRVPIDQTTASNLITQTVNTEVGRLNLALALWVILAIVVSAYVLAGLTLLPIRRAMEKQKRFIANVSHELRTPLSVMKMDSEVALMDPTQVKEPELLDILKSNLEEVNRMSRITQFLLDFSNSENSHARLSFSRVDLGAIVTNVGKIMSKVAAEKNIALTFTHDSGPVMIQGNAVALEEMVLNLVKNAVNYTPPGGSVSIEMTRRRYQPYGSVTLSVKDTGVGIPEEDLPRLFEPFYRGKNVRRVRSDHGSAGLGLAIVREIANLHRASITVKSEVGKGTTISLKFTLASYRFI